MADLEYSKELKKGVTRGLHAEPWDKFVSLANGRVFCAWVDVRPGESFGQTFSVELDPSKAVYVPKGVANGYQTLDEHVVYTYLVNAHWSPDAKYTMVNAFDPALNISWPIPKEQAIVSEKDEGHPVLSNITPFEG
jgi:dTDP-4-dehydrorhamnose 3,5-epimerase-like enzyme